MSQDGKKDDRRRIEPGRVDAKPNLHEIVFKEYRGNSPNKVVTVKLNNWMIGQLNRKLIEVAKHDTADARRELRYAINTQRLIGGGSDGDTLAEV
jgi:hypothetical protein